MPTSGDDDLGIPLFLRRQAIQPVTESEGKIMADDTETETVETTPTPKANSARKASGKAKGAAKGGKGAKATPKAKAASKPAKATIPLDAYGYRVGSLKSKAAGLYGANGGATLSEVKAKLGSVQLNVLTELGAKGFKIKKVKEDGEGSRKVTRYILK